MERSQFAQRLRDAIVASVSEFCSQHPDESPYGFALILGQCGNYLGFAVATEEGLRRTASRYVELGYRYEGFEWQEIDNEKKLAVWLRWAHPDDGWYYEDFPSRFEIAESLRLLVSQNAFGDDADELEEFCTDVLASLERETDWQMLQQRAPLVVGVYEGDDPRDFLRTATRCNPYATTIRLWNEHMGADEASARIRSPNRQSND